MRYKCNACGDFLETVGPDAPLPEKCPRCGSAETALLADADVFPPARHLETKVERETSGRRFMRAAIVLTVLGALSAMSITRKGPTAANVDLAWLIGRHALSILAIVLAVIARRKADTKGAAAIIVANVLIVLATIYYRFGVGIADSP